MTTLLRIAYDGTEFHGYAKQPGFRTVQSELEAALAAVFGTPVVTRGASRTDAGVHAEGQIVGFEMPFEIPNEGLVRALAGELPRDLIARAAWDAERTDGGWVNPRFHNLGKHYRYRIRRAELRSPGTDRYEWHFARGLDVALMREAARSFVGEHDFAAFRAADCQAKTTVRRVTDVTIEAQAAEIGPEDPGAVDDPLKSARGRPLTLDIDVRGEAFLKNMVRIMVGTLVDVGVGRTGPGSVAELIRGRDRTRAGATAPACGLTLVEVRWPDQAGKVLPGTRARD